MEENVEEVKAVIQTIDVPEHLVIDGLRNEVAILNDERITLTLKLQFANEVIEALRAQLKHAHEHPHQEENLEQEQVSDLK